MVKIKPSHNKDDTFEVRKWRDSVAAKIANLSQELEDLAASVGVSDEAFGVSWNGNTTNAASKNALYDKIAAQDSTISGKSNTGHSHNDLYYTEAETNALVAGLQDELDIRPKILATGVPLIEFFTSTFENILDFELPIEFMQTSGNVVTVEMFMQWFDTSLHEIEIRLQDESANDEQIGIYITDTAAGEAFLGRVTITFISLAGSALIGIVEVNGLKDGVTQYVYTTLAFALEGSPFDLSEQLTIQINARVPDELASIQSIYALATATLIQ